MLTLIRLGLTCAVIALFSSHACSQSRHIEVRAVDELERPLVDATVTVTIVPPQRKFLGDEVQLGEGTARLFALTDARGSATIDVTALDAAASDQPLRVMVWKKGHGPQSVTAQKQALIRCYPVLKRRFQIVDAERRPMNGLKVEHLLSEPVATEDQAKMVWWTDVDARTDEFGVVTLDGHANGSASFETVTSDGVRHQAKLSSSRSDGDASDPRDLVVVRLSRHGKIEGRIPAQFAQDYDVRLISPYAAQWGKPEIATRFDTSVRLQADGRFTVDALTEGNYWLVVRPKLSSDSARVLRAGNAPQALQPVQVEADRTITVPVSSVSLAKVSGRIVSRTSGHDFSGARVSIAQALPGEPAFPPPRPPFAQAQCLADGTFECWLPPGKYELACESNSLWKADKPLALEVGAGAAGISAGQLPVSPMKQVNVVWQSEHRRPNYVQNHSDYRFVFSFKDSQRVLGNLTDDGYGPILVPLDAEVTGIHQNINNSINPRPNSLSAFVDIDPSEHYRLELISKPQGLASNISMRGRVVDTHGNGIAHVPVEIAMDFKMDASGGMQKLERVKTELDGSFQIPPRQLLGNFSGVSQGQLIQGQFTFSASILANSELVEVQKVISLNSKAWELTEIEFADLVVEPLLLNKRLNALLLNAGGQPAAGEFVQLADRRRLIGVLADTKGQFEIDNLSGPTWLLRSSDWSIHAFNNYDQPVNVAFESKTDGHSIALAQRMPKEQRLGLAKQILNAVPKLGTPAHPVSDLIQPLSDEAYLSPDDSFEQVLTLAGPEGDVQRMQFARFWNRLDDSRLDRLVAAMATDTARLRLLRMMADRRPSAEAYARVMDAIPSTIQPSISFFLSQDGIFEQVAQVGLKLHNLGRLDPYHDKIRHIVEQWGAVQARAQVGGKPRPFKTSYERTHGPICRALADPEQFAREALDWISTDPALLSNEERSQQSFQVEAFLILFPNEHDKLTAQRLRMARSDKVLISWGEQSPLNALDAFKREQITASQLRQVAEAALLNRHAEAGQMLGETNKLIVRSETSNSRFVDGYGEMELYQAARSQSRELGRQQAWFMARDYLSGRYAFNAMSMLPIQNALSNRTLAVAYCLSDERPQLAQHIVKLGVPRVLNYLEHNFEERYSETMDMTFVAWFDPQATCDLLDKLSQRYADELEKHKAQPVGQPGQPSSFDYRMLQMTNNLALLRHSCLRGLLLDELSPRSAQLGEVESSR